MYDITEISDFSIREILELFLQRGIDDYERLHGSAPKKERAFTSSWNKPSKWQKTTNQNSKHLEWYEKIVDRYPTRYTTKFVFDGST